jgi:hypothetical protein
MVGKNISIFEKRCRKKAEVWIFNFLQNAIKNV